MGSLSPSVCGTNSSPLLADTAFTPASAAAIMDLVNDPEVADPESQPLPAERKRKAPRLVM